MSIGGNPAVPGSVTLSDATDTVVYNGQDVEKVVLDGTTIWEKVFDITGTASYNQMSRTISMDVNLGNLTSWSWRAVKNGGGGDTGENDVFNVNYAESNEVGVSDDGVWTITFKGFKDGVHKSTATATATATVATPFIEITNVEELDAPLVDPTIAGRLNDIPNGTVATGEVVMVGPFGAVSETTYTKSGSGWDVTGFNTGVNRVEFRDNNGTTQARYTGPNLNPEWYNISFAQRPGFGSNSGYTVVMESLYMPDHHAAWYGSTAINNAISG